MRHSCFRIVLDDISLEAASASVARWCNETEQRYVVTPNPEMVVLAHADAEFRRALNEAVMALPDGIGLVLACRAVYGLRLKRVTGIDFLVTLLTDLPKQHSFFFLGATSSVLTKATEIAKKKFHATVAGAFAPPLGTYQYQNSFSVLNDHEHEAVIERIQKTKPTVLIVALGHGQQEKWMHTFLKDCPSVKVAIGVGGSLDILAGRVRRAPKLMRRFGVEWLWRLLREPWRINRIRRAIIGFPLLVMRWMFSVSLRYRTSVVGFIMNKQGKVLVVERKDQPGHWQLPQGGVEPGERLSLAIQRELYEELGTDKFEVLGRTRKNVYRYSWKTRYQNNELLSVNNRRYGYRGQKQTIFYLRFVGNDNDFALDQLEHVDWRWVEKKDIYSVVNPVRHAMLHIALDQLSHVNK